MSPASFPVRLLLLLVVLLLPTGCTMFEDNGTHLAYALETAAKALRTANANETIVRYEPLDGGKEGYYVELTPSLGESGKSSAIWGSYLVVSGKRSGGTSYHNRFVFVPRRLYLKKEGGPTELVLRKDGDRISVIELR